MKEGGHLSGGGPFYLRYPIRASMATAGVPAIAVTDTVGIAAATTTSFADTVGLALDTGTYTTTQSSLSGVGTKHSSYGQDLGAFVTVSVRPDLIVRALCSGGATASTALTLVTNTSASADGTTISDSTNIGSADMTSGVVWCLTGNNAGYARPIVTHNASTSFVTTVPFPNTIAVNDTFCWVPYNTFGTGASAIDGVGNVQATTNIDQADASIASGTGGVAVVVNLELNGRSDTFVNFILQDHQFNVATN